MSGDNSEIIELRMRVSALEKKVEHMDTIHQSLNKLVIVCETTSEAVNTIAKETRRLNEKVGVPAQGAQPLSTQIYGIAKDLRGLDAKVDQNRNSAKHDLSRVKDELGGQVNNLTEKVAKADNEIQNLKIHDAKHTGAEKGADASWQKVAFWIGAVLTILGLLSGLIFGILSAIK